MVNNNDANSIEINLENLNSQVYEPQDTQNSLLLQKDAFNDLLIHLRNIKKILPSTEAKRSHIYDSRAHNTILINAKRGMGKTLFLINVENQLSKLDNDLYETLLVLKPIDPTILNSDENFLTVIIAKILNRLNENTTLERHNDSYRTFNEKLRHVAQAIDSIMEKSEPLSAIEQISQDQSSLKLEQLLHEFFEEVTKITGKKTILLQIDDIDMQIDKGFEVLEVIRRFLASPYIVPVVTGDIKQYTDIVEKNFIDKLFPASLQQDDKSLKKYKAKSKELAQKFLTKIFPAYHRVSLKTMLEFTENNQGIPITFKYNNEYLDKNEIMDLLFKEQGIDKTFQDKIDIQDILGFDYRSLFQFFRSVFDNHHKKSLKVDYLDETQDEMKKKLALNEIYDRINDRLKDFGMKIDKSDLRDYLLGQDEQSKGKTKDAIESFKRAFELKPSYLYFKALFDAYVEDKDLDKVETFVADNLYQFETNEWSKEQLTKVYFALGDFYNDIEKHSKAIEAFQKVLEIKPDDIGSLNNMGTTYGKLEKYEEAIEAFQKVLEVKPDNFSSLRNLGLSYTKLDKYEEAIDIYEKVLKIKPDDFTSLNNIGAMYNKLEKYEEALETFQKALEIKPDDIGSLNNIGAMYDKLEKYEEVIEAFQKVLEIEPDNFSSLRNLGLSYTKLDKNDEAIDTYEKVLKIKPDDFTSLNNIGAAYDKLEKYEEALETFQKVLEIKPDDIGALNNMGITYGKLEMYEEVIETFQKALEIKPDDIGLLKNIGITYGKLEMYEEAIETFQKALEIKPDDMGLLHNIGIYYGKLEKHEEALETFQKVLEIKPDDIGLLKNIGIAYDKLEKYEEAIETFQRALVIKPNDIRSLNSIGTMYDKLEKYEEAIETFKKILEVKPDNIGSLNSIGIDYGKLEKYEEALETFQKVLELKPDNLDSLNNIGVVYGKLEKYEEAIETFQKILLIKPDDTDLLNNIGVVYGKLEKYEEALDTFQKALEIKPDDMGLLNNMGAMYGELELYEEALETFQKALEFKPDDLDSLKNIGIVYGELEKYEDAIDIYEKILEIEPEDQDGFWQYLIESINMNFRETKLDVLIKLYNKTDNELVKSEITSYFEKKLNEKKIKTKSRLKKITSLLKNAQK